jgi:hypothetical protein
MRKQPVSFQTEVVRRFQFLVDHHGLDGPEFSEQLVTAVWYRDPGLQIGIFLQNDSRDGAGTTIATSISLNTGYGLASANLDQLVEAVAFAPRHRVAWKAHTADAMRNTLDDNAIWVRRLMPILRGPDALERMRNATQHVTDKAGNPKKRRSDIRWRYS